MRIVRELHRSAKGPVANDEDWWGLVYQDGELLVEHEWDHVNVYAGGEPHKGIAKCDIEIFLAEPGQAPAHAALRAFFAANFEGSLDA